MKKTLLAAGGSVVAAGSAMAQEATTVNSAITSALTGGLTSSTAYAVAAIGIAVVFFTLKLGKRGLNKS